MSLPINTSEPMGAHYWPVCPVCNRNAPALLLVDHGPSRHLRCHLCNHRRLAAQRFEALVAAVVFRDWIFCVEDRRLEITVRAHFSAPCNVTGVAQMHSTRRWILSPAATDSEVIQTVLKLVLTAIEHEAREEFTWHGRAIFGPHFDVQQLVTLCDRNGTEVRR